MKNIIIVTIDTMCQETLDLYPFPDELFINNFLKKRALVAENVFSTASFTEGSMNSLLCGELALENSSFLFGSSRCPHTLFDHLSQNGYQTFLLNIDSSVFGHEWIKRGDVDYRFAHDGDQFDYLYQFRLKHFAARYREGSITPSIVRAIEDLLETAFDDILFFFRSFLSKKDECSFYFGLFDPAESYKYYEKITTEFRLFCADKQAYVFSLLADPEQWFSKIRSGRPIAKNPITESFQEKNKKRLETVYGFAKKNALRGMRRAPSNLRNLGRAFFSMFSFRKVSPKGFSIKKRIYPLYSLLTYGECGAYYKKEPSICAPIKSFNYAADFECPSFQKQADEALKWIKGRGDKTKPFCIYLQPQDFHLPSIFWTYDIQNQDLFNEEMSDAEDLISRVPRSFHGNFFDMLSLKYLDKKIQAFYYSLQKNGVNMANTLFVITADHGCWNSSVAKRLIPGYRMFYKEHLHVPLIVHSPSQKPRTIKKHHSLSCFPNSITEMAGLPPFKSANGNSLFSDPKEEFCIEENLGFGCPDIETSPLYFIVHNDSFWCIFKTSFFKPPSTESVLYFFWTAKDPLQTHPLSPRSKVFQSIVPRMLPLVKKRYAEIEKYYSSTGFFE